ncbi:MAG: SDR family NAD(P)-dependent oxidoreductase [Pseudobacteriovorax sp.]|nr:SDR family NAD(P)-dependent oxidoreductase [Pseudobacteriovorax sp.]
MTNQSNNSIAKTDRRKLIASGLFAPLALSHWKEAKAMERISKQTVLITGAGSGFGFAMAEAFARQNFKVIASLRDSESRNRWKRDNLQNLRNQGLDVDIEELDVTKASDRRRVINKISSSYGRLDVLINNAGMIAFTPVETATQTMWQTIMDTNLHGPMALAGDALPLMRRQGSGLIIQVSSRVGRVTIPGLGLYATSKFAFECASETAHYEASRYGVDFAIIQPSAFRTDVNRNAVEYYRSTSKSDMQNNKSEGFDYNREFLDQLERNFSGTPTRDPREVSDLAVRIANTPRDQRRLRYPVGDFSELGDVAEINDSLAGYQRNALNSSGFGSWFRS